MIKKILKTTGMFVSCFIIAIIFFILISNTIVYNDCRDYHIKECEEAHNLNQTFLLCSGFIIEPSESDKDSYCAIHPEENCESIPHGCNLAENEYIVGLRIPFTKLEWRFAEQKKGEDK